MSESEKIDMTEVEFHEAIRAAKSEALREAAVEAAARQLCTLAGYDWDGAGIAVDVAFDFHAQLIGQARSILEAAAPHMLSHEREETRLAHLDAVVNRETKRAELAAAWDDGAQAGFHSTMEGFNGECAFDHCAPDDYPPTNPYSGEKWEVSDWIAEA